VQGPEEIRKALVQEIALREKELQFLRETLSTLDKALQAADAAKTRVTAAREYSVAKKALAAAEEAWTTAASQPTGGTGTHKIARQPVPDPKPAPPIVQEAKAEKLPPLAPVEAALQAPPVAVAPTTPVQRSFSGDRQSPQGKYVNMKLWKAIQNLLQERGQLSLEEIVYELQQGGASLGDNPARNVSTAVSYMNDKIFHVNKRGEKMVVSLLNSSGV
jgi:hypothetical protein